MTPARTRAFLGLLITLWSHSQQLSGSKPLPPRNVKLSSVEKGLKVTWDPPSELEGRPVDGYSIGYGKSMKTLRFLTVGKERRSELLEDVEPGVLHFLKMSAENKDGMSRPIYRAETPGGGEWVKLDGFAVDPLNRSSPSRMMSITSSQINPEPPPQKTSSGWQISPQSSSGPEAPYQTGGLSFRAQYKHRVDLSNHQADQRNNKKPKLASESVYMVSLQAPKPQARSAPISSPSKQIAPELEVLDEVEDITVRILSPQSVLITWLDPVVEKKKEISEGSRSYTVKYREKGESARWEFKDTSQRRLMLETLAADSMYEFSIRISQGNQQGKWSASVFQRTPESAPSGPPENFEVKPLRGKGTAVTAAWDPPEQTNGRVREYILSYAPALKPFGAKAVTYRGSSTSATIEGLTPGDRYTFKIRAVNRKGQGPQTKAIIVTMPASTHLRSTESHNPSQSSMEKSYMIESDNQNPDETEKSISQSATQSPPANRLRPLSQTRSYHSIFSSVRGSIRDGGSRKNSHSSSIPTKVNEDVNTTDSPAEEETNLNEAVELTKPDEDKESLQTKDTKEVKPNNSDQVPKPSSDKRLPWIPQTSSIVDISRLRRPNSQRHGSRSRIRNQDTSNSFQKQESPDSRNNPTSTEGSHTRVTETVHVVKSQESKPEPVKEIESSSSLSSSPESSRSSYFSNSTTSLLPNLPLPSGTSTGTMLSNGRGVSRLQQGSPKTDSSSVSSQSRLPTRLSTDNQEIKNHDTNQANTLQGNQKEEQRTEVNEPISDITEQNENFDSHEEKGVDFSSSRTKTSATTTSISIPNHSSRRVTGSRRKDGRIPWNRANSSVDAGRPIVKGLPSQVLNSQLDGDKNIISLTPAPIESTAMPISKNPHRVNIKSSHSHKADDATTEAPQITTTEHHKLQSLENESMNRKDSINMNPESLPQIPHRVPVLASNSRVRSPVVSRLKGSRFPSRLHPVQHRRPGAFRPNASSSSSVSSPVSSQNSPLVESTLTSDRNAAAESLNNVGSITGSSSHSSHGLSSGESSIEKTSPQSQNPVMGSRLRSASTTGNGNSHGKGKNGRSNLTAANGKESSASDENSKRNQVRYIIGPDGTKMIVDLNKGVLMNENGTVLRDSRGRSRKVALGADGKTIFDDQGSPLVHQEQLTSFEDGRRGWPMINPSDKYQTIGRKPINRTKLRTTTTIATTTAEPTTETLESTTLAADPTCPPGLFSRMDKNGLPMLDNDGILNCYSEDELFESTTVTFVTTSPPPTSQSLTPVIRLFNNTPSSEFDVTGKKRFTAPYVNYISKDPGAPCSLTEALEYLQVDVLADLMEKDQQTLNLNQPPKNKPHNVTVVAMEGCHSFVILDWARPLKDDMVSGYMVQSASYDDVLNNRWSTQPSSGTHLPVENLKPNSRYYFRVQAKNIFGLGPVSETLTYVTESDDPLLIARPPGGEPIWIPFSFRYNQAHSSCKGSQFVKRTWYRKFVGVVLCNSLRYKIFMADGLRGTFHSIADTFGHGEDHCQFVDSHLDGRTGPHSLSFNLPTAQGYYRSYRQEPVNFGAIGRRTPHPFIGWYECGVPIPGKW